MTKKQIKKEEPDKKLSELTQEIEELKNGWRRTQADFENYQKRTETQKFELIELAKADFMTKLTPVLDNFRRAFEHAPNDEFAKGVKQIEKQLEDILNSEGLIKIKTDGVFDPNMHEAISFEENKDVPADHIISELESGWMYGNKVLKPAKVRVSKGK